MKTTRISMIVLGAAVMASSFFIFNTLAADESPTVLATLNKYATSPQLSPPVEEIVKLTKAGVADPVTLAYIQASPTAYSLDSQDILRLQREGVSSQVMTAMMQHGDELRRAATEASKQSQATAPATVADQQSAAPTVTTAAPSTVAYVPATAYPASSVSVTYIGYPSYSYYSGYYGYGGCYPNYYSCAPRYYGYGYCGPRVGFGVGYGVARYGGYGRGYYAGYGRHR